MARLALHADDAPVLRAAHHGGIMQSKLLTLTRRVPIDVTVDAAGVQEHARRFGEERPPARRPGGHCVERREWPELGLCNGREWHARALGIPAAMAIAARGGHRDIENETDDPASGEAHVGSFVSSHRKDKGAGEKT